MANQFLQKRSIKPFVKILRQLMIILAALFSSQVFAQNLSAGSDEVTIPGTIDDEKNQRIPGASEQDLLNYSCRPKRILSNNIQLEEIVISWLICSIFINGKL